MPVVAFSFPPQRCMVLNEAGELRMKWPEHARTRSQDLEPYYHDCDSLSQFTERLSAV